MKSSIEVDTASQGLHKVLIDWGLTSVIHVEIVVFRSGKRQKRGIYLNLFQEGMNTKPVFLRHETTSSLSESFFERFECSLCCFGLREAQRG